MAKLVRKPGQPRPLRAVLLSVFALAVAMLCTALAWSYLRGTAPSCIPSPGATAAGAPGRATAAGAPGHTAAAGTSTKQAHPQPVVLLMVGRTGSSILTDVLNRHPSVLFVGEMYNHPKFWVPKQDVEGFYLKGRYRRVYERWLHNQVHRDRVPQKQYDALRWVGMKVNTRTAQFAPGTPHWKVLAGMHPKVLCLHRRNDVKAVISEHRALTLASLCKTYSHVPGHNCTIPAKWRMDVPTFRESLAERLNTSRRHLDVCRYAAARHTTLMLAYEDILDFGLARTADRLFEFLGLAPEERGELVAGIRSGTEPVAFEKTTPDNLHNSLENIDELILAAREMYADAAEQLFQ